MKEENQSDVSNFESKERGASMGRITHGQAAISDEDSDHKLDDSGTNQSEAARILKKIRDEEFDSSDEKLALALGRSGEEIAEWLNGEGTMDGDALMKVRALARERKEL